MAKQITGGTPITGGVGGAGAGGASAVGAMQLQRGSLQAQIDQARSVHQQAMRRADLDERRETRMAEDKDLDREQLRHFTEKSLSLKSQHDEFLRGLDQKKFEFTVGEAKTAREERAIGRLESRRRFEEQLPLEKQRIGAIVTQAEAAAALSKGQLTIAKSVEEDRKKSLERNKLGTQTLAIGRFVAMSKARLKGARMGALSRIEKTGLQRLQEERTGLVVSFDTAEKWNFTPPQTFVRPIPGNKRSLLDLQGSENFATRIYVADTNNRKMSSQRRKLLAPEDIMPVIRSRWLSGNPSVANVVEVVLNKTFTDLESGVTTRIVHADLSDEDKKKMEYGTASHYQADLFLERAAEAESNKHLKSLLSAARITLRTAKNVHGHNQVRAAEALLQKHDPRIFLPYMVDELNTRLGTKVPAQTLNKIQDLFMIAEIHGEGPKKDAAIRMAEGLLTPELQISLRGLIDELEGIRNGSTTAKEIAKAALQKHLQGLPLTGTPITQAPGEPKVVVPAKGSE